MRPSDHLEVDGPQGAPDSEELREWCDALDGLLQAWGPQAGRGRAVAVLDALLAHARHRKLVWRPEPNEPYLNTVGVDEQPPYPGDRDIERRLSAILRWNALAMVIRANAAHGERTSTGSRCELPRFEDGFTASGGEP